MQRTPALVVAALAACTLGACERADVRARAAETTTSENVRREVLEDHADQLRKEADLAEEIAKKRAEILETQAKVLDQQARIDRQRAELHELEALRAQHASSRSAAIRAHEQVLEAPQPMVEQAPASVPTERIEIESTLPDAAPSPSTSAPPPPPVLDAEPAEPRVLD